MSCSQENSDTSALVDRRPDPNAHAGHARGGLVCALHADQMPVISDSTVFSTFVHWPYFPNINLVFPCFFLQQARK